MLLNFWGYVILRATGRPGNNLWFNINSPGRVVSCYLRAGRAAKVLARAISSVRALQKTCLPLVLADTSGEFRRLLWVRGLGLRNTALPESSNVNDVFTCFCLSVPNFVGMISRSVYKRIVFCARNKHFWIFTVMSVLIATLRKYEILETEQQVLQFVMNQAVEGLCNIRRQKM